MVEKIPDEVMETGIDKIVPTPQVSEAELMRQLDTALKSKDFKVVARVSNEIAKFQKTKEQAELEVKQKALEAITDKVKNTIAKALKPLVDAKELDLADGIWFTQDFDEKIVTCRLTKTAARKASTGGGGGAGKKFDVNTNDLLAKFGNQPYKESGMSIQQAWESNTDKNYRYAIRQNLLKLNGTIS
jgi:hypothetical protein